MNPMNDMVNAALKSAMAAVHQLDDQGCTIHSVAIGGRKPTITIDAPAPRATDLQGALKSRITVAGVTRATMAMNVHGCQVEWTERYATGHGNG